MTRAEIEQIVNHFFIEDLEIDEELVKPTSRMKEDLKIDSLDYVDIAVLVDEHFGFKIKIEDTKNLTVLSDFYDYIESKISE